MLDQYGTKYFGENDCPKPETVIIQYTELSEVYNDPLTYSNCGTNDWIANYKIMNSRINKIKKMEPMLWWKFLKDYPMDWD